MSSIFKYLTLSLAGALLALPCMGQHVDAAGSVLQKAKSLQRYGFYAGVHVAAQVFRVTSDTYPIEEAVVRPLHFFIGTQLGPHLALQAGYLQRNPAKTELSGVGINWAGQPYETHTYSNRYDGALPILLRYDLAHHPLHQVHLDVLLGLTVLWHRYQTDYTESVAGNIVSQVHEYSRTTNYFATAGLGLGLRVTSRLDLQLEATGYRNLTPKDYAGTKQITWGLGGGLRYCFNVGSQSANSDAR